MSTRSEFLGSALAVGATTAVIPTLPSHPVKPPMLVRGDRVGLIAPASPLQPAEIDQGVEHFRSLGFEPVLGEYVRAANGYLAGSDAQRAEDFNRMARDPSIRAIVALRGGYGTMRILTMLDYDAIRSDPKIVMGYSDLTAIVNAVTVRSGVVAFHGPVATHGSSYSGEARDYFTRTLMSTQAVGTLRIPNPQRIVAGRSRGRLAGGNLSLVSSLAGTPFAIPMRDAIFFFEETEEAPYRLDRMLTQLSLTGALREVRGALFGQCTKCTGEGPTPTASAVIAERLRPLGVPAIAGAPIGHIPIQWLMPIGVEAELDADTGTLTLPEPAVSAR